MTPINEGIIEGIKAIISIESKFYGALILPSRERLATAHLLPIIFAFYMMLSKLSPEETKKKGGFAIVKPIHGESAGAYQARDDGVYYMLTLDPSVKDHRVIALLIDYTSRRQECPFYRIDDDKRHCGIAPEFTVMWNDCRGMCFVSGITCPLIIDHVEGAEASNEKRNFTK